MLVKTPALGDRYTGDWFFFDADEAARERFAQLGIPLRVSVCFLLYAAVQERMWDDPHGIQKEIVLATASKKLPALAAFSGAGTFT